MAKFSELPSTYPHIDSYLREIKELTECIQSAFVFEVAEDCVKKVNDIRRTISTAENMISIRMSQDTRDHSLQKRKRDLDKQLPKLDAALGAFYRAVLESPLAGELEAFFGAQCFRIYGFKVRETIGISDGIVEENRLVSEYNKLIMKAKFNHRGKSYRLSDMGALALSTDKETRHSAVKLTTTFFERHAESFDQIFDQLVKVRHQQARVAGYDNFVPLAFARLKRTGYDATDIASFRNQIKDAVVPIATMLREHQAQRLGIEPATFTYYDDALNYPEGNPSPIDDCQQITVAMARMFAEMSPETQTFFSELLDQGMLDIEDRPHKQSVSFCTYLPEYRMPFMFLNYSGTSSDVATFTHEAGHAFQMWCARDYEPPEYVIPTMDTAELHSLGMEVLALPWMESFFKDDAKRASFDRLSSAIKMLPYCALVDHFQHEIYTRVDLPRKERHSVWRKLEQMYMPSRHYGDLDFLEQGGYWFRQSHIFGAPFYYIEYGMAQIVALQIMRLQQSDGSGWAQYLQLCNAGGSRSFLELLNETRLKSPFSEGAVADAVLNVKEILMNISAEKLTRSN